MLACYSVCNANRAYYFLFMCHISLISSPKNSLGVCKSGRRNDDDYSCFITLISIIFLLIAWKHNLFFCFAPNLGMLISIFCESHTMANFVSTGAFYPMIVLCGLLWPLEGMPQFLRDFALLLPFTIPTISVSHFGFVHLLCFMMQICFGVDWFRTYLDGSAILMYFLFPFSSQVRNILSKGMPITNPNVYSGFIVIFLWIAGFFFLCLAGLRRKK